jgi:hypothetical protein
MEHTPNLPAGAPAEPLRGLPGAGMALLPATIAARLLSRHSPQEIAEAIEVLVDVLDMLGGDPDNEDDDPAGQYDEDWYTAPRPGGDGPGCTISDPDFCTAWDDRITSGASGAGGIHYTSELAGSEDDGEGEQMQHDVPVLAVYSAAYDPLTDQRECLGMSNLMTSFVGQNIRSADTGAVHSHRRPALGRPQPGVPV